MKHRLKIKCYNQNTHSNTSQQQNKRVDQPGLLLPAGQSPGHPTHVKYTFLTRCLSGSSSQPRMFFSNLSMRLTRLKPRQMRYPTPRPGNKNADAQPEWPLIASWLPILVRVAHPTVWMVIVCNDMKVHCLSMSERTDSAEVVQMSPCQH